MFYQDAIRVRITNHKDCGFIGPLSREHLCEHIRALMYKYGSQPEGEWPMLAEVSRIPRPDHSFEDAFDGVMEAEGNGPVSKQFDQIIKVFNGFQEFVGY